VSWTPVSSKASRGYPMAFACRAPHIDRIVARSGQPTNTSSPLLGSVFPPPLRHFSQALGTQRLTQLLQRNTNAGLGSVDLPDIHPGKLLHRTAHALDIGESGR